MGGNIPTMWMGKNYYAANGEKNGGNCTLKISSKREKCVELTNPNPNPNQALITHLYISLLGNII